MTEQFTVRLFKLDDLPGILRLWRDDSGWGEITEEQWRSWYVDTPWGESIISVVEDSSGEIVGQGAMNPFDVRLGKEVGVGYRVSAPILRTEIRTGSALSPNHPSRRMLKLGMETAKQRGAMIAYAMPLAAWRGFFSRIPGFQVQLFKCAVINLTEKRSDSVAEPLIVERTTTFEGEHIQLWESAFRNMRVQAGVERNAKLMTYRSSNQLTLNIRTADSKLLGYVEIKSKTGLVVDLVAKTTQDIGRIINAVSHSLRSGVHRLDDDVKSLKVMVTPQIQPHVDSIGSLPDDYKFLFCVCPLSNHVDPDMVLPSQWYLTGGD
jgi:hypothetical protein